MAEGLRPDGCFDRIHPSANFDSVGCVADTSAVVAKDVALAVADTSTVVAMDVALAVAVADTSAVVAMYVTMADTSVVVAMAYTTAHAAAAVDNLAEEVQHVQR